MTRACDMDAFHVQFLWTHDNLCRTHRSSDPHGWTGKVTDTTHEHIKILKILADTLKRITNIRRCSHLCASVYLEHPKPCWKHRHTHKKTHRPTKPAFYIYTCALITQIYTQTPTRTGAPQAHMQTSSPFHR